MQQSNSDISRNNASSDPTTTIPGINQECVTMTTNLTSDNPTRGSDTENRDPNHPLGPDNDMNIFCEDPETLKQIAFKIDEILNDLMLCDN